jgi:branched-chain amino acid aminotransferase
MSNIYLLNGKAYPLDLPGISIDSRAIRYGEGIFETIRMHNGKMPLFKLHMDRLFSGLQTLQLRPLPYVSPEKIEQQINLLVAKNQCGPHARIRISFIGRPGGVWDRPDDHADLVMEAWSLPENYLQINTNGLIVDVCEDVRKSNDVLSNLKSNNYLPYLYAANKGKQLKVNDMLLINHKEFIVDSTIANVFIVKENNLYTPMLEDGPVSGIMRRWIIENLSDKFIIKEKHISMEDLLNADEVFLTNAVYGLRWIQRIRNKNYGNLFAQKIYQHISKQFEEGSV